MTNYFLGAALVLAAPVFASANTINFDQVTAPYLIADAHRVTNQYAAQGIMFGGHGAIVNSVGDFGTGFSAPNVLAFVSGQQFTGSSFFSQTYDTVRFSAPQTHVTFDVGTGLGSPKLDILTKNAMGKILGDQMITLGQAFQTVTLTGGFSSFVLDLVGASNGDAFAIDNLNFTAGTSIVATPEPLAAGVLALGVGGLLGVRRRAR